VPLIVFKGAAKSPHIKAHLLSPGSKISPDRGPGESNRPNTQPIDLPNGYNLRGMVTPPTHQHAIGHVTIVQMSQDQKNCDDEQF